MDFIAIDFETANEKRESPCSIGIVVVKEGEIVKKEHFLIKPKEMRFLPMNIGIHGIRPRMVEDQLEFNELWEQLREYFQGTTVIAHNAAFDISVLRKTLELYEIEKPDFNYICTMKLAKNFYSNLKDSKLNTVNDFLGFKFNHHNALADAEAATNILLNIANELNINEVDLLLEEVGVSKGEVNNLGYKPSKRLKAPKNISRKEAIINKDMLIGNLKGSIFRDEVVVFTGKLNTMTRVEAMSIIRRLGGTTGSSVTKKTTCLITNSKNLDDLFLGEMSNKFRRAVYLREQGQKIQILNEEEFLEIIKL
ncbi:MAG: exonuclease domain-containing protein [Sarcina sp.]